MCMYVYVCKYITTIKEKEAMSMRARTRGIHGRG